MKRVTAILTVAVTLVLVAGDEPKPEWTMDLAKMKVPSAAASGKIGGKDFKPDAAKLENWGLYLRQGKDFFPDAGLKIFLFLKNDEKIEGKTWEIGPGGKPVTSKPHIYIEVKAAGDKLPKSTSYIDNYVMKLEFGMAKGGKIPGKIYVCVLDDAKSFVAGTFEIDKK